GAGGRSLSPAGRAPGRRGLGGGRGPRAAPGLEPGARSVRPQALRVPRAAAPDRGGEAPPVPADSLASPPGRGLSREYADPESTGDPRRGVDAGPRQPLRSEPARARPGHHAPASGRASRRRRTVSRAAGPHGPVSGSIRIAVLTASDTRTPA